MIGRLRPIGPIRRIGLLGLMAVSACAPAPPDSAVLLQAHDLAAREDWSAALPLLREYLCAMPDDPGGHLLLGRFYLAQSPPYVAVAEGEFQFARALLDRGAPPGVLAAHYTPEQLSIALYMEESRAKLALARLLQEAGAPGDGVLAQVNLAFETALAGKRAHPDSEAMLDFFNRVRDHQHAYWADKSLRIEMLPAQETGAIPATSRK